MRLILVGQAKHVFQYLRYLAYIEMLLTSQPYPTLDRKYLQYCRN